MQTVDLSAMSFDELTQLAGEIEVEVERRREQDRERLIGELKEAATRYGVSVEEFIGEASKKKRSVSSPKYRDPNNPQNQWSGRGKQPGWVKEAMGRGLSMEQLEIHKENGAE